MKRTRVVPVTCVGLLVLCGCLMVPPKEGHVDGVGADDSPTREPLITPEKGYELQSPLRLSEGILSPDGSKVAFIAGQSYEDEEIVVWDLRAGSLANVTRSFGARSCYGRLQWSPRGDAIAAPLHPLPGGGQSLFVLPLDGSPQVSLGGTDVPEYAWSPDGEWMAYADVDRRLYIVKTDGTGRRRLSKSQKSAIHDLVWWQDGRTVVIAFIAGWSIEERNVFTAPVDSSGELQITNDGGYGFLERDANGTDLAVAHFVGWEQPLEHLQIPPGTHDARHVGELDEHANLLQSRQPILSLDHDSIEVGEGADKATLDAQTVESFLLAQQLQRAKQFAAGTPLTLQPDVRRVRARGRMVALPRQPIPVQQTTVVAQTTINARQVERVVRLGPIELELLGISVEPAGGGHVTLSVGLRYLHKLGRAVLDTEDLLALGFKLQEQYKPASAQEVAAGVQGHYRSHSVYATSVTVDAATGVWSSIMLQLIRYDETQGFPQPQVDIGTGPAVEPPPGPPEAPGP